MFNDLITRKLSYRAITGFLQLLFGTTFILTFIIAWFFAAFKDFIIEVAFNAFQEAYLEIVIAFIGLGFFSYGWYKFYKLMMK